MKETDLLIEDLKVVLNKLQSHTIGYLEMYYNSFEPIIKQDGDYIITLVVSRAFGIQTLNIRADVFPTHLFPDNKTLSEMLESPKEYCSFCEEHKIKHR